MRNNLVIKMIPMLNPDGVAHGHYRTDTRGVNLNRVYLDPDPHLHPSIFATKSIMLHHHQVSKQDSSKDLVRSCTCIEKKCHPQRTSGSAKLVASGSQAMGKSIHLKRSRSKTYPFDNYCVDAPTQKKQSCTCQIKSEHITNEVYTVNCSSSCSVLNSLFVSLFQSGVAMYIDLHAHATKRGCFFYGNFLEDEKCQVENMLYPRLVALNTPHLDFEHCLFSAKNMYIHI